MDISQWHIALVRVGITCTLHTKRKGKRNGAPRSIIRLDASRGDNIHIHIAITEPSIVYKPLRQSATKYATHTADTVSNYTIDDVISKAFMCTYPFIVL